MSVPHLSTVTNKLEAAKAVTWYWSKAEPHRPDDCQTETCCSRGHALVPPERNGNQQKSLHRQEHQYQNWHLWVASHGRKASVYSNKTRQEWMMRRDAVQSSRSLPTFRRNTLTLRPRLKGKPTEGRPCVDIGKQNRISFLFFNTNFSFTKSVLKRWNLRHWVPPKCRQIYIRLYRATFLGKSNLHIETTNPTRLNHAWAI